MPPKLTTIGIAQDTVAVFVENGPDLPETVWIGPDSASQSIEKMMDEGHFMYPQEAKDLGTLLFHSKLPAAPTPDPVAEVERLRKALEEAIELAAADLPAPPVALANWRAALNPEPCRD